MPPILRLDRTLVVFATVVCVAGFAGLAASAADAGDQPTVAELLQRIEALEKALGEVRRDAERCGDGAASVDHGADAGPAAVPAGAGVVAVPIGDRSPGKSVPVPDFGSRAAGGLVASGSAATSTSSSPASVTAGYNDGFFLASADGAYALRIGGYLQADSRFFIDNDSAGNDAFTLRRARLDLRGTVAQRFSIRLTPDFAGDRVTLADGYIDAAFAPWLTVRAGRFKTPFGIERLQSGSELLFVERALTDNLIPGRDLGVQLSGEAFAGVGYAFAVLNGVADGTSGDGDLNDGVDIAARVFARPLAASMYSPLRGAGLGLAGTWGTPSERQLPSFRTSARSTFFRYDDDVLADGHQWRVSPQAAWVEGSLSVLAEYVISSQQVERPGERAWIDNHAWQARASWLLTGEKATYAGAVVPDAPFNFGGGGWGAWETALRWSSLDVDGDAFSNGFAEPYSSARRADAIAVAVNWFLNRNVKVNFNYEHTGFGGGAADRDGDRDDENVFLTRMQLAF